MLVQLREERDGDHAPSEGAQKFAGADVASIDSDDLTFLLRTKGLRLTSRQAITSELIRRGVFLPSHHSQTRQRSRGGYSNQ